MFAYCGAVAGSPGQCRDDDQLGRLNITWTMGYRQDADGRPILFDTAGNESPAGTRLMYDTLYAFGGRSFSIRDEDGKLVWDSGAEIERFLASNECKLGTARDIPCATWFNANHEEGDTLDNRSDNKAPSPKASRSDASATRPSPSSASSAWAACWCMTSPTRRRRCAWIT